MEYFLDEVTSKDILLENMRKMNSFGDRLTGTKGHNEFCRWLEEQLHDMGQETFSNEYEFEKWEAKRCGLNVGGEDIHVSSAFHYSGLTGEEGVAGELRLTGNSPLSFSLARGKNKKPQTYQQYNSVQQARFFSRRYGDRKKLPRTREHVFRKNFAYLSFS